MKARIVSVIAFLALALGLTPLVTAPAQASVADPNATVLPNGKWFSGNLLSMWGLNCSTAILGSAYNEIMIQGYASYGATNGAPKVNETYYAMVTLSEPGFPCGTGISIPELRLRLPANTQLAIDAQHPIRCFVTPRFQSVWDETTNAGNWTIDAIKGQDGKPLTGPWCRPTPYQVDQFTWSIGSPAMANGTMHKVFVPLRSTSTLSNVALQWEVRDPVTYEGMQLSEARLWVFPQSLNQASPVFFFPDKAVIPFWDAAAPAGAQNRAEFFANLYTGGQAGYLCYEVRRKSDNGLVWECANGLGFDGTVAAGQGIVQLLPTGVAKGPNGGYAPFAFDPPEYDKDYTVQWFFRTSPGGSIITSSPKIDFRSLAGPDGDQDGVIDAADKCPGTKGTAAARSHIAQDPCASGQAPRGQAAQEHDPEGLQDLRQGQEGEGGSVQGRQVQTGRHEEGQAGQGHPPAALDRLCQGPTDRPIGTAHRPLRPGSCPPVPGPRVGWAPSCWSAGRSRRDRPA